MVSAALRDMCCFCATECPLAGACRFEGAIGRRAAVPAVLVELRSGDAALAHMLTAGECSSVVAGCLEGAVGRRAAVSTARVEPLPSGAVQQRDGGSSSCGMACCFAHVCLQRRSARRRALPSAVGKAPLGAVQRRNSDHRAA
eukprot:5319910-Prymnesium_polylepis.1